MISFLFTGILVAFQVNDTRNAGRCRESQTKSFVPEHGSFPSQIAAVRVWFVISSDPWQLRRLKLFYEEKQRRMKKAEKKPWEDGDCRSKRKITVIRENEKDKVTASNDVFNCSCSLYVYVCIDQLKDGLPRNFQSINFTINLRSIFKINCTLIQIKCFCTLFI